MRNLDRHNWGRRYLMCRPDHFTVEYAINPWMTPDDPVNPALAMEQWQSLVATIEAAGGTVETIAGHPMLPDMVFTANLGVVADGIFVPASMHHAERAGEPELASRWASRNGFSVLPITDEAGSFEGMGDALPFSGRLLAGTGPRSAASAWTALTAATGWPVTAIELPDERFYHVDLVFSPLDERHALVAPMGLTSAGLETITAMVENPILLTDEEAMAFSANSIVVGDTVIMPACSPRLRGEVERAGFAVHTVDVGEFLKAGGAVRCLTLPLDVRLETPLSQIA